MWNARQTQHLRRMSADALAVYADTVKTVGPVLCAATSRVALSLSAGAAAAALAAVSGITAGLAHGLLSPLERRTPLPAGSTRSSTARRSLRVDVVVHLSYSCFFRHHWSGQGCGMPSSRTRNNVWLGRVFATGPLGSSAVRCAVQTHCRRAVAGWRSCRWVLQPCGCGTMEAPVRIHRC